MIIITAHTFGLGPTALALLIAETLQANTSQEVRFIGTKECCAIIPDTATYQCQIVAGSHISDMVSAIGSKQVTAVVTVLSQAGIDLAKLKNVPSFFIDPLVWFWKTIPPSYLEATHYIALRHPGAERILDYHRSAFLVSQIIPEPSMSRIFARYHIIHLGGVQNPFESTLPESYLELIAKTLLKIERAQYEKTMIIAGQKTVQFLSPFLIGSDIEAANVSINESAELLSSAARVTSLPGLTGPLISFNRDVPVAFLPPINLSQWWHISTYKKHNAAPVCAGWDELLEESIDLSELEERESSYYFHHLGNSLHSDQTKWERAILLLKSVFELPINKKGQRDFVDQLGYNGAAEVVALMKIQAPTVFKSLYSSP